MKAVIMILTWVNGQSIATSQIEFTSMTSCEAAHSAITHEAQMMHNYLCGVAEQSGPVFPFSSVICVNK
jgi:hypothetical protein